MTVKYSRDCLLYDYKRIDLSYMKKFKVYENQKEKNTKQHFNITADLSNTHTQSNDTAKKLHTPKNTKIFFLKRKHLIYIIPPKSTII